MTRTLALKDINITKVNDDGSFSPFPIRESEYYKALSKLDDGIYNDYVEKLSLFHYKGAPVTELSYTLFIHLSCCIEAYGFDGGLEPRIFLTGNEAGDGQHRLAILYYLKPDSSVEVNEQGKVIRWVS